MGSILLTIISIVIGAVISYLLNKYYFKKSIKEKSLTPYLHFISRIFSDIDPELKKKLKVTYNNVEVRNFYQIQFVIANSGDKPIRDCIEPLRLLIPNKGEVLDVNMVYVQPEGREVTYEVTKDQENNNEVFFKFPLLNSGDYFITKLLIKGDLPKKDEKDSESKKLSLIDHFKFKICVDELPPLISTENFPFQYEYELRNNKITWSMIGVGILIILMSSCLASLLFSFKDIKPDLYILNLGLFFSTISFIKIAIFINFLLFIIIMISGIAIIIGGLPDYRGNKKTKFKIPGKLVRQRYGFFDSLSD